VDGHITYRTERWLVIIRLVDTSADKRDVILRALEDNLGGSFWEYIFSCWQYDIELGGEDLITLP
jgi:hypothetical protein